MITAVRAGIVFLDVNLCVPHCPDRAPIKPAKVHDQIRRNVPNIAINLFRSENQRLEWLAFVVGQSLDSRSHFVLKRFVLSLRNQSLRFASLNIEENARVTDRYETRFDSATTMPLG